MSGTGCLVISGTVLAPDGLIGEHGRIGLGKQVLDGIVLCGVELNLAGTEVDVVATAVAAAALGNIFAHAGDRDSGVLERRSNLEDGKFVAADSADDVALAEDGSEGRGKHA